MSEGEGEVRVCEREGREAGRKSEVHHWGRIGRKREKEREEGR